MNLKSIICSGLIHVGVLGVGLTGGSWVPIYLHSKRLSAIQVEYAPEISVAEPAVGKIKAPKSASCVSKKASRKQIIMKEIKDSKTVEKIQTGKDVLFPPQLGNYLRLPTLIYPELARQNQQEGEVELELTLNTQGCVQHVEILESTNVDLLDQAAEETFKGKCIISSPILFPALSQKKLILPVRFYLQ